MSAGASAQWTSEAVLARLRSTLQPGKPVSVEVFLNDDTSSEDMSQLVSRVIQETKVSAGLGPDAAKVGKIHRLAKSFSVLSDTPRFFETLSQRADVKSLLESEQSNIFPAPARR